MSRTCRCVLVLFALTVAAVAVAEEGVAATPELAAVARPAAEAAPSVTLLPAEAEAALVVDGDVETIAMTCSFCPFEIGEPWCPSGTPVGYECSAPIYNCSCGFCNNIFGCVRP